MRSDEEIVRLAIRRLIKEDGEGGGDGGYAGAPGGDYGWGMGGGGGGGGMGHMWIGDEHMSQIGSAFAAPFQELFGGVKKAVVHARTLLAVSFEVVATTLIPFFESDFHKIFEKRDRDIQQISSEYAEVRKATWDAFKNKDFVFTAFIMAPSAFITTAFITKTPKVAIDLLKLVEGDYVQSVVADFHVWIKQKKDEFKYHMTGAFSGKITHNQFARYEALNFPVEYLLMEDDEKNEKKDEAKKRFNSTVAEKLVEIYKDPKVQEAIRKSEKLQKGSDSATKALVGPLQQLVEHASSLVDKMSSIQEIDKMSGGKISKEAKLAAQEMEKSSLKNNEVENEEGGQDIQPKEKSIQQKKPQQNPLLQQIESTVVAAVKAKIKEAYIQEVKKLSSDNEELPKNHPYFEASKKAIEKITAL